MHVVNTYECREKLEKIIDGLKKEHEEKNKIPKLKKELLKTKLHLLYLMIYKSPIDALKYIESGKFMEGLDDD